MPTYEFRCDRCGSDFDAVCRMAERHNQKCLCGGPGVQVICTAPRVDAHDAVYDPVLDVTYSSRKELESKMRRAGFSPAGDKKGGARNEEHQNLGKLFSYKGQANRGTSKLSKGGSMDGHVRSA